MSNETHFHHHRGASAPSSPSSLLFVRGHVALTISRSDCNVSSVNSDHVIEIPSPCLFRDGTRIPLVRYKNNIERGNQQAQDQHPHVLSAYHLRVALSFSGADNSVGETGAIPFVWCLVKLSLPAPSPTALHSSPQPQVFSKTLLLPTSNLTSIGGALARVEAGVNGGAVRDHVSVVAKCLDISDLVRHAHHWLDNLALCSSSIEQQRAEPWRLTMCVFVPTLEVIHAMVSTTCALDRMRMERPMLESLGLRWINGEAPSQLQDQIADLMPPLRTASSDSDDVSTFLGCRPSVRFQHAVSAAARAVESSNQRKHHNSSNLQKRARDDNDEVSSTIPVATRFVEALTLLVGVARLHIMFEFSSIDIAL
ncbi:Hypothetical protein, putative [Bodo saltans]|uniref:Uncharacterized protein n=1 Tax=Bodo saltans TaxID=75058 RepID=A0A0S4JBT1_BODSA|nr:Hypothetical protein, putative [Bodo saltans]|eukprot:CUG88970.1 Hypothetical protein, putative [Bodo saltans]